MARIVVPVVQLISAFCLTTILAISAQADPPTRMTLLECLAKVQSLFENHTEIEIVGVYARSYVGLDTLYEHEESASTLSPLPPGEHALILWVDSAIGDIAKKLNMCALRPDLREVRQHSTMIAPICNVRIVGHIDQCALWGIGDPGMIALRAEPTRLLAGPPTPDAKVVTCLVVTGGDWIEPSR